MKLRVSVNWHGFKRAGGLMLGAGLCYPLRGLNERFMSIAIHLVVVTVRIHIKYERTRKKR